MEYRDERDLHIYTDGSSYPGPRRGGVGVRFVMTGEDGNERFEDYPLPGYHGAQPINRPSWRPLLMCSRQ